MRRAKAPLPLSHTCVGAVVMRFPIRGNNSNSEDKGKRKKEKAHTLLCLSVSLCVCLSVSVVLANEQMNCEKEDKPKQQNLFPLSACSK